MALDFSRFVVCGHWRSICTSMLYAAEPVPEASAHALQALASVGLADGACHNPNQLSGGQHQRVAIAQSLVNHSQIVLADEPTGALDSRTNVEILAILQHLNRQKGIDTLMVTHEPDIGDYTNRSIYVRDRRIVRNERILKSLRCRLRDQKPY